MGLQYKKVQYGLLAFFFKLQQVLLQPQYNKACRPEFFIHTFLLPLYTVLIPEVGWQFTVTAGL